MTDNYVAFAATAIRRMMEKHTTRWNSISLRILLDDMADNDAVLTRKRHRSLYKGPTVEVADEHFNELVRSNSARYFSASRIRPDIRVLEEVCRPIKRLVDKVIAHTEADRRRVGRVRFEQLDRAVDALELTFRRYDQLVRGSTVTPSLPPGYFDVRDDFLELWPAK